MQPMVEAKLPNGGIPTVLYEHHEGNGFSHQQCTLYHQRCKPHQPDSNSCRDDRGLADKTNRIGTTYCPNTHPTTKSLRVYPWADDCTSTTTSSSYSPASSNRQALLGPGGQGTKKADNNTAGKACIHCSPPSTNTKNPFHQKGPVAGAFRQDGLVFMRPCKSSKQKSSKRKNLKIKEFTIT